MQITKLDLESENMVQDNIERLKQLFPEIVTEGKIDFNKLREVLGDEIDDDDEKYEFTWNGKHDAIRESQKTSKKTLRPCIKESKNWDTTKNLYIEGDNLDVLKLLQKTYQGKIKMMYIDPPYNTGKDAFIYKDKFQDTKEEYEEKYETAEFQHNPKIKPRYHTNWLNMMYPRLRLAQTLLTEDGVIFISIDDHEIFNLKKICDEIFGQGNFIANLPTVLNLKGNNDQFGFSGTHEYTLVYAKNYEQCLLNELLLTEEEINNDNWEQDEYGYYKKGANLKATGINAPREKRPNLYFPIYVQIIDNKINWSLEEKDNYLEVYPITENKEMSWRWSKEKFLNEKHNVIITGTNIKNISIYKKQRPSNGLNPSKKPKTLFYKKEYSSGNGTNEMKKLFNNKVFDFPKPVKLIEDFIEIGTNPNDIILDLFSGSATTAQSIMNLNDTYQRKNKYILIQLAEKTDEKTEAYKEGYKNICEIGKERIRRAGDKLLEEHPDSNVDIGFKVLKLDSSNFKEWNPTNSPLEEYIDDSVMNVKEDRTDLDIVYEIMIKYGIDLTSNIDEIKKSNYTFYSIGYGALIVCLDDEVDEDVTDEIIEIINENVEIVGKDSKHKNRVVFKDISFLDDSVKTNIIQVLEKNNIEDFVTY